MGQSDSPPRCITNLTRFRSLFASPVRGGYRVLAHYLPTLYTKQERQMQPCTSMALPTCVPALPGQARHAQISPQRRQHRYNNTRDDEHVLPADKLAMGYNWRSRLTCTAVTKEIMPGLHKFLELDKVLTQPTRYLLSPRFFFCCGHPKL